MVQRELHHCILVLVARLGVAGTLELAAQLVAVLPVVPLVRCIRAPVAQLLAADILGLAMQWVAALPVAPQVQYPHIQVPVVHRKAAGLPEPVVHRKAARLVVQQDLNHIQVLVGQLGAVERLAVAKQLDFADHPPRVEREHRRTPSQLVHQVATHHRLVLVVQ